jgi:hypothetical protein
MRVEVSPQAADWVMLRGGRLWVWTERTSCCAATPPLMRAAASQPARKAGFRRIQADGLELWFSPPLGQLPDVLEIDLRGKRKPRVEAYWDGCLLAL